MSSSNGIPIEDFIQALTSQLDRAQTAMALKAKNRNLPLTFAVKDLSIDLRTHVEVRNSAVHVRPAEPNETQASTIHLALTTVTRPMIEENSVEPIAETEDDSLDKVFGEDAKEEEREELRRRLEWAGIHSVEQLRTLQRSTREDMVQNTLQQVTRLPVNRLRQALERSSQPLITQVIRQQLEMPGQVGHAPAPVLRIRGNNLVGKVQPKITIGDKPLRLLQAAEKELVVELPAQPLSGALAVETAPGRIAQTDFELVSNDDPYAFNGNNGTGKT